LPEFSALPWSFYLENFSVSRGGRAKMGLGAPSFAVFAKGGIFEEDFTPTFLSFAASGI
jgi:hypothetical protein